MEVLDKLGVTGIPAITILCFLSAEIIKQTPIKEKWLPAICGVIGCALGLIAALFIPDYPSENIISVLAVGTVSGLSATGIQQVYTQLIKDKMKGNEVEK